MSNGHLSLHYVSISGLSMDITQFMLVISYHISCYQTISSRGQKKEVSRNKQAIVKSLYWILLRFIFSLVNGHNGWPIFLLLLKCSKCKKPHDSISLGAHLKNMTPLNCFVKSRQHIGKPLSICSQ